MAARAGITRRYSVLEPSEPEGSGTRCGFYLAGAAFPTTRARMARYEAEAPALADWIKSLAPANPIKAAAEDAILPLVVFGVFVGFAVTRLPENLSAPLINVFRGIGEAMIVIVRWVLWAAPVGVFALSLGVGLRAGLGAAGTLLQYVTIVSLVTLGVIAAVGPVRQGLRIQPIDALRDE